MNSNQAGEETSQRGYLKCARATAVYVVFIPVCRKCVYIEEADQGTDTFQEEKKNTTSFVIVTI